MPPVTGIVSIRFIFLTCVFRLLRGDSILQSLSVREDCLLEQELMMGPVFEISCCDLVVCLENLCTSASSYFSINRRYLHIGIEDGTLLCILSLV